MLKQVLMIASLLTASGLMSTAIAADAAAPKAEVKTEVKADAANAESFKAAVDAAKVAKKAASTVGGEWRDIGKFLKKADALATDGNFAKAEKLAKKAESQAILGKAQMEGQSNIAFPAYFTK